MNRMLKHSKTTPEHTSDTNKEDTVYTLEHSTPGGTALRKHRHLTRRKPGAVCSPPISGTVIDTVSGGLLAGCTYIQPIGCGAIFSFNSKFVKQYDVRNMFLSDHCRTHTFHKHKLLGTDKFIF